MGNTMEQKKYPGMIIECAYPGCEKTFRMNSPTHKYCKKHSTWIVYETMLPRHYAEVEKKMEEDHLRISNTKVYTSKDYDQSYLEKLVSECRK